MKKLILCGSALLFSLAFANAQGWSTTGAHDDFATETPYNDIAWSADEAVGTSSMTISRPGDGSMVIDANSIGRGTDMQWPTFRVSFATPLDLEAEGNADIVFDIENDSDDLLFAKIELEDASGNKSNYEPNISDITSSMGWGEYNGKYPRKANNGFVLAGNTRGTFTIDLSSVAANLGGLTRIGWIGDGGSHGCTQDGPSCGPVTAYQIDPSAIVAVIFTVNYMDGVYIFSMGDGDHTADYILDAGLDASSYTGNIVFHDFKIGTLGTTSTKDAIVDASLSVYPNPANEDLNVSFKAKSGASVSLMNVVGNSVYSTSANAGENNIKVNTSALSSGIYILKIATENGTVARKVTIK